MIQKTNKATAPAVETAEAILENVFGESIEISPNRDTLPERGLTKGSKSGKRATPLQIDNVNSAKEIESVSEDSENSDSSRNGFGELPLAPEIQSAIKSAGYQNPTPIQSQVIPHLLYGRDVLAQSQTGSGKTAAFAFPILTRIETRCRKPQVLVLVPTRELAIQVGSSFQEYGSQLKDFNLATIYGGQNYEIQYRQLKRGPQVIVGTPGRVIDHIKNGMLEIGEIECLVLDEADEMLNMGFIDDIEFVLKRAPAERQIALFSATMPEPIREISKRYLNDPVKVTIRQKTLTAESIRQRAVLMAPRDRIETLIRFLEVEETDGAIVFTRTRETTALLADKLSQAGFRACALNGEMPQRARERTIEKLKCGRLDILVATDIAARGLDVSRISHVFNYDLPEGPEAYTHRIGRTGRAGRKGEALLFLSRSQQGKLKFIEKTTRQKIEFVEPPTADEINRMRIKRFYADIDKTITSRDMHFFQKLVGDFIEKSNHSVEDIAAAIAMMAQNGKDFLCKDQPVRERKESAHGKSRSRNSNLPAPGMARYRIAVGKQDGIRPGNIVGAVTNEADISGDEIGSITIRHSYSTIDLPTDRADEILERLADTRISGRALQIRPYRERPNKTGSKERFSKGKARNGKNPKSRRRNSSKPDQFGKRDQPSAKGRGNRKTSKARSK